MADGRERVQIGRKKVSVWILGDQLLENHPAVAAAVAAHGTDSIRVVMIESRHRTRRMRYHRRKLVLLFSAMRHYARRLQDKGHSVDYRRLDTFLDGLKAHVQAYEPDYLYTMAASAYGGAKSTRVHRR